MNWSELLNEIILGAVGIVLSALGLLITALINKYVKNEETKSLLTSLTDIARNAVLEVYQTYVEALKKGGIFDEKAQKEAQDRALKIIRENMPEKVHAWLEANYSDAETYLLSLIESQIGQLKNSAKK